MDAIDRRSALRTLFCGAVAAGLGTSLLSDAAEAMPLAIQKDPGRSAGDFSQQAQAEVTGRPPGRPPSGPPSHRPPPHHHRVAGLAGRAGGDDRTLHPVAAAVVAG